jgi:hypothetical protein
VLVSAAALRAMPVQYVLSLLESFTFGDVHVRSVEHSAAARVRVGRSTAFEACVVRAVLAGVLHLQETVMY